METTINNTMTRRVLLGLIGAGALATTVTVAEPAEGAGVAKWNRSTVYVLNRLGPGWPVASAAEAWDDSSALDLITTSGNAPSTNTSRVTVKWGRLPAGILGECSTAKDGMGRIKSATILINDRISKSYPASLKLLLVRHEIGHALGFNHTRKRDVMNQTINTAGVPLLGYFHVDTLRKVYGR